MKRARIRPAATLPALALMLAPMLGLLSLGAPGLARAQNLPGQASHPGETNIRNYTLRNNSGQAVVAAEASFEDGQTVNLVPGPPLLPAQAQSFGTATSGCLKGLWARLKDGRQLALPARPDCHSTRITILPDRIEAGTAASGSNRPQSD